MITRKADGGSDIPAHTYQLSFEPNKEWSEFYASAKEIHQYWKNVAKKYNCDQYFRLGRRVIEARWDAAQSLWLLKASSPCSEGLSLSERHPNTRI
jgi:cation diffusion facilitator CzcD-associated flavoprotein CzcO